VNIKLEKTLLEIFGEPLESTLLYGKKIGDIEGITKTGVVGVRDMSADVDECPMCGKIPSDIDVGCSCEETAYMV